MDNSVEKWISVKERNPKNQDEVLVFAPNHTIIGNILIGKYFSPESGFAESWTVYDFEESKLDANVTHWMPLPKSPIELQGVQGSDTTEAQSSEEPLSQNNSVEVDESIGWKDIAETNASELKKAYETIESYREREKALWKAFGEFSAAIRESQSK